MNDVVVMMERNGRNNLTANISRVTKNQYKDQYSDLQWELHPTENAFFRRDKGREKNYELTGIGIGLKQQSGLRD